MRRTAEEAKRRFSDSYNALMTFDNDDLAAMDAEIDDAFDDVSRSEEHTSELQSPCNLVCRLLLEKKKKEQKKTQNQNKQKNTKATHNNNSSTSTPNCQYKTSQHN